MFIKQMPRVFIATLILLFLVGFTPAIGQEEKSISQGENLLAQVKVVRVVVKQSYEKADKVSLPFFEKTKAILERYGGFQIVGGDATTYDATLSIEAKAKPLGHAYAGIGYCYAGAEIEGNILLRTKDRSFRRQFSAEITPPESITKCQHKSPNDAPFDEAFEEGFYGGLMKVLAGLKGIDPLISALKDNEWGVRKGAADALGEIGDPRAVEPLISVLVDKHPDVREAAAYALGEIKDSRAVEPLISALKDKDSDVCSAAAYALGEIKDSRAVEPLISALKDKDSDVCSAAASALGEIKDPRAIEPLVSAMKDRDLLVCVSAALALEEMADPRAVEPLISALEDEDWHVRFQATRALGKIKDPRAVEPLISALKDENWDVREAAADALEEITGQSFGENPEAWQKWWEKNKKRGDLTTHGSS